MLIPTENRDFSNNLVLILQYLDKRQHLTQGGIENTWKSQVTSLMQTQSVIQPAGVNCPKIVQGALPKTCLMSTRDALDSKNDETPLSTDFPRAHASSDAPTHRLGNCLLRPNIHRPNCSFHLSLLIMDPNWCLSSRLTQLFHI